MADNARLGESVQGFSSGRFDALPSVQSSVDGPEAWSYHGDGRRYRGQKEVNRVVPEFPADLTQFNGDNYALQP